ncbi:hypothetical protein [Aequorivita xiaoshiensis]|uniref:Uncharacterized protein n=1 Tax=Aequorivita xiaoshiensis TaxID=2874476 RepID=A0A9X1R443_9FLAO|nr:hypothetical protein [Aequorivita xiaoshiensis]MCG2431929.1 hypothetical protein [Aequorivita xiaoshiensis]
MEHLILSIKERELHISNFLEVFKTLCDEELIGAYKNALKTNTGGEHLQGLRIQAMRKAIFRRLNKTPVDFKDTVLSTNENSDIPNLSVEIKDPKIQIVKEIKKKFTTKTDTESQVIVHIDSGPYRDSQRLRIWDNTYLKCKQTARTSKLLFSENIAIYPKWSFVASGTIFSFTLIFENLPKECLSFDLIENIPEMGGFFFKGIRRNNPNVYHLRM